MKCFLCDNQSVRECPRCGAPYCDDHGGELCARCMNPETAQPSYYVYRGSLVALGIAAVVLMWLLLAPSRPEAGEISALADTPIPKVNSPTPVQTRAPQPTAPTTPSASETPVIAIPVPTETAKTYTIQPGD